jgi:hypothetical protein
VSKDAEVLALRPERGAAPSDRPGSAMSPAGSKDGHGFAASAKHTATATNYRRSCEMASRTPRGTGACLGVLVTNPQMGICNWGHTREI